jgi:undecaprenol kinase
MPSFMRGLSRSVFAAWRGVLLAFRGERTFRVMVACALAVIVLVSTVPFLAWERLLLLLLTGAVLVLELLNSMVERLVDLLKPRLSAYVGDIKDLMAAAVLIAACVSALIAFLLIAPYLHLLFQQV